jgi:hypothetical protein
MNLDLLLWIEIRRLFLFGADKELHKAWNGGVQNRASPSHLPSRKKED